jgi:hypothetical protein
VGFPRTPDKLLMLSGSRAQQLEVVETRIDACGPYNLGGFATHLSSKFLIPTIKT